MICAYDQVCAALGERARTATAEVPHMFDNNTTNNGASSGGAEYWNIRHYSNHNSTSNTVHSNLQQQQQHWIDVNVPSPAHDSGIGTFNTDVLGTDDDDQ
jgi:hypothetical protein